jgi:hypothetical protein
VQLPVDDPVPVGAGIHQQDHDLGVLHPPGGAGVLALHPDRIGALLEVAALVDDQHRFVLAQVLDQQPIHKCLGPSAQVGSAKAASDPTPQPLQHLPPAGRIDLVSAVAPATA